MHNNNQRILPYFMWFLTIMFFGFQFIMRLAPGLVINELIDTYKVTSSSIGVMSAMYYLGYAGMQIPIAVILDRFRPNYVIFACIIIASMGMFLSGNASEWWMVILGRFFVGFGSAAGFLGVSKIVQIYFPKEAYAKMIGFSFTFGLLGAIYGGRPVNDLIAKYGYQNVFSAIAIVGAVIAILILVLFKLPKNYKAVQDPVLKNLKQVVSNPQILMLAIANLLLVGTLEGLADVWGVNFFQYHFGVEKAEAATMTSLIYMGMILGGPLLAYFAKMINSEINTIALSGIVMALIYAIIFKISYHNITLTGLMITFGIMSCYQVLVLSVGSKLVSFELRSITVAFLNCINMMGGTFFHTVIGNVIAFDYYNTPAQNYKLAITVIPIAACIGSLIVILLRLFKKKTVAV
ncbi:MFS transporter [Rickettsiales endosymbiont of Stachyamoeba lipophora]|uniref:MFS transporter n=1 Tax=Rickettsiales endosymbiont of Stachyamoeba lipophora TaxID=2486578 RepID=UPI000F64B6E5|nr:MFS transporter [Rickettsiales endosymbiont of Stachyamoeba lipophora]AZL15344.1 MFS transporter [Rickettsiales endosymbiont of Stachyamoeba lipophora]